MKKIGTLWRQGLVYPYQSSNLLSLLLLVVMLIAGGNVSWAQTETIQAGSSAAGADFSYSDLTVYSYDDNYWAKKNNSTVISLISGSDFTFTNVNGVTITGITVKGVADNNAAKTSTVTITDDASTPNSINTGSVSWSGRQVTTPTSQALTGVNSLKMTAGTKYTVSNSGSNLGIQIEITYTQETQKESFGNLRLTGDACNRTATILSARSTNEYLRFTFADAQGKALSPTDIGVDDFDCILSGDDVIEIEKKTIDTNGRLAVYINPKSATGTATLTVRFKGNSQYNPIDAAPITITVSSPVSITFTANTGGTVAAKGYSGEVDLVSGNTYPSQSVTFTATPAAGYLFDNWHDGSAYVGGGANPYVTTVNSDLTLTANFIESRTINVALATSCAGMGTVALYERDKTTPNLSGTAIKKNLNLDIVATANTNYEFLGWRTTADGTGDFVSTDAKFQKKAEDIANNTTYYAYFQEIDHTVVGKTDNTTPYNGAHSLVYPLAAGKTRHISFVNHNSGTGKNWYNWILNVASTSELATTNPDIMMLRADNYDIKQRSTFASAFNWETFVTDMNGATVVMDVTNSGKHIYVNSTITTTGGKTYKYSAICNDRTDAGTDAHLCFTVEYSHITNLSVGDEAQAYELTYAIKLNNTDLYSDTYGTVTIKNNQGLALRKGTYAPFNEDITYKAEAKSGYRWYKWESGYTDAERNITVTNIVNPCAVFVQDITFAITTQPVSNEYNYNATATALTVAANSAFTMTYQWYSNTVDANTGGTIIEGATNASYTPSTTTPATTYYYCVVTEEDTGNTLTSNTAKIDVSVPRPGVSSPENVITMSCSQAGATLYYTLDGSDPRTSDTRIEYTDEIGKTTAIHNNVHLRAVTCVDGLYSSIQGVDLKYERVTVLEARGEKVAVHGEFTNSTCTSSIAFQNEKNDYVVNNIISPNSIISKDTKAYRGSSEKNATIELRSTSAYKIVVSAYGANAGGRGLESITVNGIKYTSGTDYDVSGSNGTTFRGQLADRIVIKMKNGRTIAQGSDVTFKFTGNVCVCYYEIYGESKDEFCDEPEIVPATFDSGNNLWSYILKPVAGTTMNYVVVDLTSGNVLSGYPKSSTAEVTISKSTESNLASGQMIRAWSVDTSGQKADSHRAFIYVESELSPIIKYNVKDNIATYNNATSAWDPAAPALVIYPSTLVNSVTYSSDDPTVGNGVDGTTTINKGSGQGVCRITATVTVAEGNGQGLKPGTYTGVLTLGVVDGYPDMLKSGQKPIVGESVEVKDNSGNKILTLNYGGWTHNPDEGNAWQTNNGKRADDWPKAGTYDGTPIDGYENQSQMNNDARSEIGWSGSVVWEGTGYTKVHPFSLPCRGAYITIVPEHNGVLTIYLVQNGCINTDVKTHKATSISSGPRTYYWFDQSGNVIMPSSVTTKQKILTGYNEGVFAEGQPDNRGGLQNWLNNSELKSLVTTYWRETVNTETDPVETAVKYQNGHLVFEKAYVKYVVNLCAGNTYYFFSNASKMGYAGLNFKPTDNINVLEMDGTVNESVSTRTERLELNPSSSFFAPSTTNAYNEVLVERSFTANTWNTICLPFAVSEAQVREIFGEGTQLVIYDGMDNKTAKFLYHVYQDILPGQAYLIRPTKSVAKGSLIFHNVTISKDVTVHNNGYTGSDIFDFIGTFDPVTLKAYDHIVSSDGKIGYSTKSISMPGYRAYLRNNTSDTPNPAKIAAISLLNAFDDLDEDPSVAEIMQVLLDDGVEFAPVDGVYNINGQKVADSTAGLPKGMYIVNGKKVFVR